MRGRRDEALRRLPALAVPGRPSEPVRPAAPILRRYLQVAPGARPHIPVGRTAPLADFERVSSRYPVFRILPEELGH